MVEHENGVAAVVEDKNCDGGSRDAPRLIESDKGDRLYRKRTLALRWKEHSFLRNHGHGRQSSWVR